MKFLQQIAKIYAEKLTPTAQLLFVFPNRRAGLFFKKELLSLTKKTIFAPEITDINSFAATLSPLHKANDIELLFALYESYVHIRSQHTDEIESIDAFIPFGTTLLGDFNEIDKYLIDTKMLFSNISDLKNLNDHSQFLSEQQIVALSAFWNNVKNEKNENLSFNNKFISLWDNLYDIYTHFTETLISKGIGYDGLIYRTAIDSITNNNLHNANYTKYKNICFIGFNSLTTSEYRIFKHFQQLGIADFYFDYPTCYDSPSPFASTVAKYYNRNLKEFPSCEPYAQPTASHIANITLHSTPSSSNQINIACSILAKNSATLTSNTTAILLSDESLMPSLIQQLPNFIEKINITMGYPLSITPIATLINHILTLQTETTQKTNSTIQFYHKPLLSILSHSNIQNIFPSSAAKIISQITRGNYIRISTEELHNIINQLSAEDKEKQFFITLFTPKTTSNELLIYIYDIISQLSTLNFQLSTDNEFLHQYQQILNQLKITINNYNLTNLTPQLLKLLINRLTSSLKVQFKGEPVEGMQIMGLLESRLLDFDNIILLGFNDSKIPGNKSVDSIIPYNLRKAYNLPTYEESDAIQAYNFYRTLYHTKNIHLIYDSRNEGAQNEISRYYYQMKYMLNVPMKQYNYQLKIQNTNNNTQENQQIEIHKTPEILRKLNSYKTPDYSLSASRIKDYITCPIKFYFSTVVGIKAPNEIKETGESSLLGRIYHKAMELYYNQHSTPKYLPSENIRKLIHDAFIEESKISGKHLQTSGFNSLIINIVHQFIQETIHFDIIRYKNDKFTKVESEVEINHPINQINFKGYIDRIDCTNDIINIIDYKTTISKTPQVINIIDLFTSYDSFYHEIFQIILYCYIYKHQNHIDSTLKLRPLLYKTYELNKTESALHHITISVPNQLLDPNNLPTLNTPINNIDTNKNNCISIQITDYTQIATPFEWLLNKLLYDIYNQQQPFAPTENSTEDKACSFCPYKQMCKITK